MRVMLIILGITTIMSLPCVTMAELLIDKPVYNSEIHIGEQHNELGIEFYGKIADEIFEATLYGQKDIEHLDPVMVGTDNLHISCYKKDRSETSCLILIGNGWDGAYQKLEKTDSATTFVTVDETNLTITIKNKAIADELKHRKELRPYMKLDNVVQFVISRTLII